MDRVIHRDELDGASRFGPFCAVHLLHDGKTIVKTSENTREAEANAMKFVRLHTRIPVPEVFDVYKDSESCHVRIVMEYVDGERLEDAWDKFSDDEKDVDGSACEDQYFSDNLGAYVPYNTEAELNQGLVKAWSAGREDNPFVRLLCKTQLDAVQGHDIVMAHNDFAPRNILVRGSTVIAILDWEFSGFYPEYWEYCKALWRPGWDSS